MHLRFRRLGRSSLLLTAAGALVLPTLLATPAAAQDFLFRRPWVSLGIRGGYAMPSAGSEVFDFTRELLTLEKSDFGAGMLGGALAVRATERVDVQLDAGWARSSARSEFRDWVGADDLPIEQITRFERIPATLTVKGYLFDRGRSVSRLAWVPATWSPFLGAGAGFTWYQFEQEGEFVDFETLDIYSDRLLSEGRAPTAHVMGGADFSLSPRVVLTGEARYSWASTEMDLQFVGFDDIDLGGFQMTAGLSVRF